VNKTQKQCLLFWLSVNEIADIFDVKRVVNIYRINELNKASTKFRQSIEQKI